MIATQASALDGLNGTPFNKKKEPPFTKKSGSQLLNDQVFIKENPIF